MSAANRTGRVGLVLGAVGARGAYEAGALSVLLPELERRGESPGVLLGFSAGAINAALVAMHANTPAATTGEHLVEVWRHIAQVVDIVPPVLRSVWSYLTDAGFRRRAPRGLVIIEPLHDVLESVGDWTQIEHNVQAGRLAALGIVATVAANGTSVVFTASQAALPRVDFRAGIRYERTEIGPDHVVASMAIPLLFPSVWIESDGVGAWYVDGATRLDSPLKPALELDADRIVLIATEPMRRSGSAASPTAAEGPDALESLVQLLKGSLSDRLVEDMHRLALRNDWARECDAVDLRDLGYLFVGPDSMGEFGARAAAAVPKRGSLSLRNLRLSTFGGILRQRSEGRDLNSRSTPSRARPRARSRIPPSPGCRRSR